MYRRQTPLVLILLLTTGVAHGDGEHRLTGRAQAAAVEISPLPPGRRLIALPDLEFPLSIDADCFGDAKAESLSISIADTIETHDVSKLDSDLKNKFVLETTFRIPGNQLAPVSIEHFCTTGIDSSDATQTLLVPAAAAANISLRCSQENAQSVRYAGVSLKINLICMSLDDQSDVPQDQGPSPSTRRL